MNYDSVSCLVMCLCNLQCLLLTLIIRSLTEKIPGVERTSFSVTRKILVLTNNFSKKILEMSTRWVKHVVISLPEPTRLVSTPTSQHLPAIELSEQKTIAFPNSIPVRIQYSINTFSPHVTRRPTFPKTSSSRISIPKQPGTSIDNRRGRDITLPITQSACDQRNLGLTKTHPRQV
jgi:hypothetical protein